MQLYRLSIFTFLSSVSNTLSQNFAIKVILQWALLGFCMGYHHTIAKIDLSLPDNTPESVYIVATHH